MPTEGIQWLETTPPTEADNRSLVLFGRGDEVVVQAGDDGVRFLLVSSQPLEELVAWYGPIVMNRLCCRNYLRAIILVEFIELSHWESSS
jgi:redox-sensitive bicupin YhaK (pirin superfamily)